MGASRVVVPLILFAGGTGLALFALSLPAGTARIAMLAAAGVDFLIGAGFLLFGVPNRR